MKNYPERTKSQQTSVISVTDFVRIRNTILPPPREEEERKKIDQNLKMTSQNRSDNWTDSLEMAKKAKLETRKKLFFEKEREKRKIDEEEKKFQEMEKKIVIDRANKVLFDNQDAVKSFHSKLLFSDIMKEREYQMEINKRKKDINEELEFRWNEKQNEQLQDYDMKERAKQESEIIKKKDQMNMINDQFQEYKVKKIREYQDRVIEGEIIKAKAKAALEEEKKKELDRKNKAIEQQNEFIRSNQELKKIKELNHQKEIEEEKRINEYAMKKMQMEDLRKRKEEEKFKEKQATRQKLIDRQIENLKNMKNKEEEILSKHIKESEEKKKKEEEDKQKRLNDFKRQIDEDREFQTNRKKEVKDLEKKEEKDFINYWKEKMKLLEEDEKLENEEKRIRNINLHNFHKMQVENKKKKVEDEFVKEQEDAFKTKMMINMEQDEFLKYAESCIRDCYNTGKDITPLIIELKNYKRKLQYS